MEKAILWLPISFRGMLSQGESRVIFVVCVSGIMTPSELIDYDMTRSAQFPMSRAMAELTQKMHVIQPGVRAGAKIDHMAPR